MGGAKDAINNMAQQTVGKIPDFTEETPEEQVVEKETLPEEETSEEQPLDSNKEDTQPSAQEVETELERLRRDKTDLIKEIRELRGTKREVKEEKLKQVEQHMDDLRDLHPDDTAMIDRVL